MNLPSGGEFDKKNKKKYIWALKEYAQFVGCKMGVVYMLPLTCGHADIGQTGR